MPEATKEEAKTADSTTSAPAAPAAEAPAAPAKPKKEKTAIPEGFVSPVDFAKEVDKHLGQVAGTTRPQIIYGYVKNSKTFPSQERGENDFPRFIVDLKKGLEWIDEKNKRQAEKAAAKTAAPAEAPASTPTADAPKS